MGSSVKANGVLLEFEAKTLSANIQVARFMYVPDLREYYS